MYVKIGGARVATSPALRSYWHVAAERQRIYHARLRSEPAPWTSDPVLAHFRFTNAYRAADRVSQSLIRELYAGRQEPGNLFLRALTFRLFNKESTWSALQSDFGEVSTETFNIDAYGASLDRRMEAGERIYSAAYIIPPPPFGAARKHRNHLLLIDHAMRNGTLDKILGANSLKGVYEALVDLPSLGPFLAYQLAIDLNYTNLLNFDENDFVMPGPGARSGILKCFPGLHESKFVDAIEWVTANQREQIADHGMDFRDLFGRSLHLIDCQNLFCETDKYSRVAHPELRGAGGRKKIKQAFVSGGPVPMPFFPPKWGLDEELKRIASGGTTLSPAPLAPHG